MTTDQHGNPFSGTSEEVARYDHAIDRLLRFHPDVVSASFGLATDHPHVPMAQALVAYLHLMSTDVPDLAPARQAWEIMGATTMVEREQAHRAAIGAWVQGDWQGAADLLDDVLVHWPTDLLAIQIGHQLDFFVGDAANLRDRPARSLPALDPDHPHTAFVHGMHAFGLEESGDYGRAEDAGRSALVGNQDDVWAVHAVVHAFEMQGQVDDGIRFLGERESDWAFGNLFTVHNWWHFALYCLEAGDTDRALAVYDRQIHHASSDGVPLEMLDASALLWRLHLDGHDTGDRFATLADAWATRIDSPSWYVFNDVHAVVALCGAGRSTEAEAIVESLTAYAGAAGDASNVMMARDVGLPAARAVVAFAQQRHDDVVAELAPIRRRFHHFGGSHAQRDLLQRTLLEASFRSGQLDLARALLAERLGQRDTSVYGWTQRARLESAWHHSTAAERAAARATEAQQRFAGAAATLQP